MVKVNVTRKGLTFLITEQDERERWINHRIVQAWTK